MRCEDVSAQAKQAPRERLGRGQRRPAAMRDRVPLPPGISVQVNVPLRASTTDGSRAAEVAPTATLAGSAQRMNFPTNGSTVLSTGSVAVVIRRTS